MKIAKKTNLKKILAINILLLTALLSLAFASAASSETSTQFDVHVNFVVCSNDGYYWIDYLTDPLNPPMSPTTGEGGNCYNSNGYFGTGCCPEGASCERDSGKCMAGIYYCNDYKNKEACEDYTRGIAEGSMESIQQNRNYCNGLILSEYIDSETGDICWDAIVNCSCEWDETKEECFASAINQTICNETGWQISENGKCECYLIDLRGDCQEPGTVSQTFIYDCKTTGSMSDEKCQDGEVEISCSERTKLGFFNWINAIAVIVILLIVYYFYCNKSKISKKVKKKR